jgi:hypothetical protein
MPRNLGPQPVKRSDTFAHSRSILRPRPTAGASHGQQRAGTTSDPLLGNEEVPEALSDVTQPP